MDFLPTTLAGWTALLVQAGAVAVAVAAFLWRAVRLPLLHAINGLGARVKETEMEGARNTAEIATLEREGYESSRDLKELHGHVGRIEGAVDRLVTAMERNRDANAEEASEIRERLVRIETKVDAITREPRNRG